MNGKEVSALNPTMSEVVQRLELELNAIPLYRDNKIQQLKTAIEALKEYLN